MKIPPATSKQSGLYLPVFKYVLLTIIGGIITIEIISIIRMKPFWLDEWFIIYNLKFREIGSYFFGRLAWNQGFPRAYLAFIKSFSQVFSYNYLSLIVIPFIVQLLCIVFFWKVAENIIFRGEKLKGYMIVLVFLSYQTTIIYFTQVKPYSMEMFCTLLALWQFRVFNGYFKTSQISDFHVWTATGVFLVAPFLSHTYPIIATPLILGLIITFIFAGGNTSRAKILVPLVFFTGAVITVYYIDIKSTVYSQTSTGYWDIYMVSYDNLMLFVPRLLNRFYNLMTLNYIAVFSPLDRVYRETGQENIHYVIYFVKIAFFFIPSSVGLITIILKTINNYTDRFRREKSLIKAFKIASFSESFSIGTFFLILFFTVWVLYFLNFLPIAQKRLNYFCVPMIGYFWLEGFSFFKANKKKLFCAFGNIALAFYVIHLFLFAGIGYAGEALIKSGEQSLWYHTTGRAITDAYKSNAKIIYTDPAKISEKKFELIIMTHPDYNYKKDLQFKRISDVRLDCEYTIKEKLYFIVIKQNTYRKISLEDICGKNLAPVSEIIIPPFQS
jgi:hypothetical protein